MVSIDRCRKLLGKAAENLTDAQIERIRHEMYRLASVLFDHWVFLKNKGKPEKRKIEETNL